MNPPRLRGLEISRSPRQVGLSASVFSLDDAKAETISEPTKRSLIPYVVLFAVLFSNLAVDEVIIVSLLSTELTNIFSCTDRTEVQPVILIADLLDLLPGTVEVLARLVRLLRNFAEVYQDMGSGRLNYPEVLS